MNYISVKAHAKINLALDVLGNLPGGYHELRTVMQTIYLHDVLFIKKTAGEGVKIHANYRWLPLDERNLAYKAADWFLKRVGAEKGVYINITKRIPVSAGLAGGSADCAATLLAMRSLFAVRVPDAELLAAAAEMSADAPFCMTGGTILAEGIGAKLTPLKNLPPVVVLLAKPDARVSTAEVFKKFDGVKTGQRPDITGMLNAVEQRDARGVAARMANVLESVTVPMLPAIEGIKQIMIKNGAMGAVMSGSGASVFGLFGKKRDAVTTIRAIKTHMPDVKDMFLTFTCVPKSRVYVP
jgi:4-diphosphocytidyl-2-C-methyl-D-erythritol kinase